MGFKILLLSLKRVLDAALSPKNSCYLCVKQISKRFRDNSNNLVFRRLNDDLPDDSANCWIEIDDPPDVSLHEWNPTRVPNLRSNRPDHLILAIGYVETENASSV